MVPGVGDEVGRHRAVHVIHAVTDRLAQQGVVALRSAADRADIEGTEGSGAPVLEWHRRCTEHLLCHLSGDLVIQRGEREARLERHRVEQGLEQERPVVRVPGARGERACITPEDPRVRVEPDAVTDEGECLVRVALE